MIDFDINATKKNFSSKKLMKSFERKDISNYFDIYQHIDVALRYEIY
jgi:hypothetical protein